jgi:carbonic anhydrase
MDKLLSGVERFRRGPYLENQDFFRQLATKQQKPVCLFITCSDSRVNPNLITQTEPGDLFLIRNAGNIVPPHNAAAGGEAATIEYSLEVLGILDIVICGHSQCGAVQALLTTNKADQLPAVKSWCQHAEAARRIVQHKYKDLPPAELAVVAAQENVLVQVNNLSTHPSVAARLSSRELRIHGWYYDIGEGQVWQYDESAGRFERLNGEAQATRPMPIMSA